MSQLMQFMVDATIQWLPHTCNVCIRGALIWIFTDVPITDISITKITDADANADTDIYFMLQLSQIYLLKLMLIRDILVSYSCLLRLFY